MKRNFEDRKRSRKIIKSKENQVITKALNMYGRVPETWELLEEIERLKSIIEEVREYLKYQLDNLDFEKDTKTKMLGAMVLVMLDKENEE